MEIKAENKEGLNGKKKIFVSGATGKTGKRIVEQLLAKGFAVKAGVRDAEKAKAMFKNQNQDLQIVSFFHKHLLGINVVWFMHTFVLNRTQYYDQIPLRN